MQANIYTEMSNSMEFTNFLLQAKKTTTRFNPVMEIAMYKEILNCNPFEYDGSEGLELWQKVGENTAIALGMREPILGRTCKQKVERQVSYFRAEDRERYNK